MPKRHRSAAASGSSLPSDMLKVMGWPILLLATVALVFGGGGSRYPLANLLVQLSALALALLFIGFARGRLAAVPKGLYILAGLTLALPLIQILPLPPAIWQQLPGRDLVQASLKLLGTEGGWFPWSVDRGRTVVAFASLIPGVALLALYPWGRTDAGYRALFLLIVLGVANFIFAALQLAVPGNVLNPYPVLSEGRLYGFFASHNSSGLFFVICLCASIGAFRLTQRKTLTRGFIALAGILMVLGTILTNSRSSTFLLLLPIAQMAWLGFKSRPNKLSGRSAIAVAAGALALIGGIGIFLVQSTRLSATWARFAELDDRRPEIWEDSLFSVERFWPFGSGMGTFRDVFPVDESLEHVLAGTPGRAHSEYFELAIEAGIFGLILAAAWAVWLVLRFWLARHQANAAAVQAAALAILCISLQGLIDYPLRNQALLCIAGLLIATMVGREPDSKGSL